TAINVLDVEEYLRGVVAKEMPASWPIEALKAQAVAARSYAILQASRHAKSGYGLCRTVHCQVYGAILGEYPSTDMAVWQTRGQIITFNGKVIDAVYHSSAAGHTLNSEQVWANAVPYLRAVAIPEEPKYYWTKKIPWRDLQKKISTKSGSFHLYDIKIEIIDSYQRVQSVSIKSIGGVETIPATTLRSKVGSAYFLSTKFQIRLHFSKHTADASGSKLIISLLQNDILGYHGGVYSVIFPEQPLVVEFLGEGYGHGVGMSQWGAYGLATRGYSYQKILERFYSQVKITSNYGD
ncbi:MAG: SpoIID/LytB domain-containing protein, partial [bacterium]|nr:SpoIID/LytB domain-containing protein [bacterium]